MTFVEKIEKSLESVTKSDINDSYIVFDEWVSFMWKNDSEQNHILETVHKILDLINNSDLENKKKLVDLEVSELIQMVNS